MRHTHWPCSDTFLMDRSTSPGALFLYLEDSKEERFWEALNDCTVLWVFTSRGQPSYHPNAERKIHNLK